MLYARSIDNKCQILIGVQPHFGNQKKSIKFTCSIIRYLPVQRLAIRRLTVRHLAVQRLSIRSCLLMIMIIRSSSAQLLLYCISLNGVLLHSV